jgi:hypothetical protein
MKLLLLSFLIVAANTCKEKIPTCVTNKINEIKAQPKWNPPAEVNEYEYQGKRVFLFSSPCCDQYNMLYDENCKALCAPTGGYTGKGDQKCPEFMNDAKHVRLVWRDER